MNNLSARNVGGFLGGNFDSYVFQSEVGKALYVMLSSLGSSF